MTLLKQIILVCSLSAIGSCGAAQTSIVADAGSTPDTAPARPPAFVAATTGMQAINEGQRVLREGGNAIDAALTIALDQIVLTGGSWNSFAGILGMLYYDASTNEVHALHAGFRVPAGESNPSTIPARPTPSGRTALVPGFMAGVEAAHKRFGSVAFARLFEPAIRDATEGVVVDQIFANILASKAEVLSRLPATRAIYMEDGKLPQVGETFVQPQLAATLTKVAQQGADYMYRGDWARHFVDAVHAEGGTISLQDLAAYRPIWNSAPCLDQNGHRICSYGAPDTGGISLIESLLIAEAANLDAFGSYLESADALFWLIRALQVGSLMSMLPGLLPEHPTYLTDQLAGVEADAQSRLSRNQAHAIVDHIRSGQFDAAVGQWTEVYTGSNSHSDAVVVIDHHGNAVVMTHTINTTSWGHTGLNVDGVSIPDAATFQQGAIQLAGPGGYLPSQLNPTLVFDAKGLRIAASAIGNVHYGMVARLHAMLSLGYSATEAVSLPLVSGSPYQEIITRGEISPVVVTAVGQLGLQLRTDDDPSPPYWIGASIDRDRSTIDGALTPELSHLGGGVRLIH